MVGTFPSDFVITMDTTTVAAAHHHHHLLLLRGLPLIRSPLEVVFGRLVSEPVDGTRP